MVIGEVADRRRIIGHGSYYRVTLTYYWNNYTCQNHSKRTCCDRSTSIDRVERPDKGECNGR